MWAENKQELDRQLNPGLLRRLGQFSAGGRGGGGVVNHSPKKFLQVAQTFSISNGDRKKKLGSCSISFLVHPDSQAWCYYAWALLGYITRLAFRLVAEKKKLGCCSISFLVHPGRSPGMMLLCLSASRIYNTFSISTRRKKDILSFRRTKSM